MKARRCQTLKWSQFPGASIKNPQIFKTHHLETLLGLSGIENKAKLVYHAEWTMVTQTIKWDPQIRYFFWLLQRGDSKPYNISEMYSGEQVINLFL